MNRLVITRWQGRILTALVSDRQVLTLSLEPVDSASMLGNIYLGKVKNIVKNINAAFVEIGSGQTGYYSLTENRNHIYGGGGAHGSLKAGDEIVVQVAKDGVKSKAPVLSCYLNFTGKYSVLTVGKNVIGFSGRLADGEWKRRLKEELLDAKDDDFGVIVRTNAVDADTDRILKELGLLRSLYHRTLEGAAYRTCRTLLYQAPAAFLTGIRDSNARALEELVTDDKGLYARFQEYLQSCQPEDLPKLRLYEDPLLPLIKLYRLEVAMEEALKKRIWLKSGGYLVIEQTEALAVVDVNTGKYAGKKNLRETILKINLEAAKETARQLRLRNLSGIILVDFIDMDQEEDKNLLLDSLADFVAADPVKTTVVGMTRLHLVEITRKKLRRPLHEQVQETKEKET